MPDLREPDPVAAANRAIRDHIRAIGGRITKETRPEYERLLQVWLDAVNGEQEPEPLAA